MRWVTFPMFYNYLFLPVSRPSFHPFDFLILDLILHDLDINTNTYDSTHVVVNTIQRQWISITHRGSPGSLAAPLAG